MISIRLPWPAKELSPNFRSRVHWPRTRALKAAKDVAWWNAREHRGKIVGDGPISVITRFHPPTAHQRDHDNLSASCKAYFDGIAGALGVDDSRFRHQPIIVGDVVKGGQVVVSVSA